MWSRFVIYRSIAKAEKYFIPANGHYLGNLIAIVGVVQVTKIEEISPRARWNKGTCGLRQGTWSCPLRRLPRGRSRGLRGRLDTTGMIIEIQIPRTLVAQSNIVFLDLGRVDGLQ